MGLAQLQMWAGHSDPKITAERYLHLMPSDLDSGVAILGSVPTSGTIEHDNDTKPVSVSVTRRAGKGASVGTPTLQ